MLTLEQFLHSAADRGEAVNRVFEQRLVHRTGLLHRIAGKSPAGSASGFGMRQVAIRCSAARRTHDTAALITPVMERTLSEESRGRLRYARETE